MMVKSGKGKAKNKNPLGSLGSSGTTTNPDVKCWNCGGKGHIRTKCPKKAKRKQPGRKGKEQEVHTMQASNDYAFSSNIVGEALSRTLNEGTLSRITIYDLGASAHMSPNRGRFTGFRSIDPKAVKAADRTIFMMTGVGCMRVDIPNGNESTAVMLKDVLYCPDLGYMLVSLANCDTAGFTVVLKDKSCCIKDSKGIQIGKIPQKQGLY